MRKVTSEHKEREYVYSRLAAHLAHAAGWNPSRGLNPCPIFDRTFRGVQPRITLTRGTSWVDWPWSLPSVRHHLRNWRR
jgi:hypothetical protein